MAEIRVEPLDPEEFASFGRVLGKPLTATPTAERNDLTVWLGISDLLDMDAESTVWGYLTIYRHDEPLTTLERHLYTAEAFIPLEGTSVMTVAPPSDTDDSSAVPDETKIRAFLLDGQAGVFFPPGSWHWAPFAITETATFLLLLDANIMDDIDERSVGPHKLKLY